MKREENLFSYPNARIRRRYAVLALLIVIEGAAAILCVLHSGVKPYLSPCQSDVLVRSAPDNQLNGITFYRYDPNTNKLCFAVRVGTIFSQNASLGIFKTAAARTIEVKDLQLRLSEPWDFSSLTALQDNASPKEGFKNDNGIGEIIRRLADTRSRWVVNMDFSNAVEITIDNFDCRIFNDSALRLAVRCRRATVNSGWPLVNLRGHVVITAADGATLESNHVIWDTRRQIFTADGMYFLCRGESRITGKGIHVDSNLNAANTKIAKNK